MLSKARAFVSNRDSGRPALHRKCANAVPEKGAGLTLDRRVIPPELHFFVPYVEKWSFDSLDDQDAFVAQMQRHRADEIGPFNCASDNADP